MENNLQNILTEAKIKVHPFIKGFLKDEEIKDLINEGEIDQVFGKFWDLAFSEVDNTIDSAGKVVKQFYELINSLHIDYKKYYISKAMEFVSKIIDRRVEWLAKDQNHKQGVIEDIYFLNYNQNKDDLYNFNNARFDVEFDDGTFEVEKGSMLKLIK